jgi:hypothetical protein
MNSYVSVPLCVPVLVLSEDDPVDGPDLLSALSRSPSVSFEITYVALVTKTTRSCYICSSCKFRVY